MFTARYGLIPYVKQNTFIFEKDNSTSRSVNKETRISRYRRCLTQYTLHGVTERSVGDLSQVVYELFPVNHGAWIGVITGCIPWNTRKYSCDVVIDCRLCTLDSCIDCTCIFYSVMSIMFRPTFGHNQEHHSCTSWGITVDFLDDGRM